VGGSCAHWIPDKWISTSVWVENWTHWIPEKVNGQLCLDCPEIIHVWMSEKVNLQICLDGSWACPSKWEPMRWLELRIEGGMFSGCFGVFRAWKKKWKKMQKQIHKKKRENRKKGKNWEKFSILVCVDPACRVKMGYCWDVLGCFGRGKTRGRQRKKNQLKDKTGWKSPQKREVWITSKTPSCVRPLCQLSYKLLRSVLAAGKRGDNDAKTTLKKTKRHPP